MSSSTSSSSSSSTPIPTVKREHEAKHTPSVSSSGILAFYNGDGMQWDGPIEAFINVTKEQAPSCIQSMLAVGKTKEQIIDMSTRHMKYMSQHLDGEMKALGFHRRDMITWFLNAAMLLELKAINDDDKNGFLDISDEHRSFTIDR